MKKIVLKMNTEYETKHKKLIQYSIFKIQR